MRGRLASPPRQQGATEERIRLVELVWYLPYGGMGSDAVRRWLDLSPTGTWPGCLSGSGRSSRSGGRLERTAPTPLPHGSASRLRPTLRHAVLVREGTRCRWIRVISDRRHDKRPARSARVVRLSVTFDARPLHRDLGTCEAVVDLFAKVAGDLGAVYAAGCVLRDAIVRRGRSPYDARSEARRCPGAVGGSGPGAADVARLVRHSVPGPGSEPLELSMVVHTSPGMPVAARLSRWISTSWATSSRSAAGAPGHQTIGLSRRSVGPISLRLQGLNPRSSPRSTEVPEHPGR